MNSPASMPQRRPFHPVRPPLEQRQPPPPQWHCPLRIYTSPEAADAALGAMWSTPGYRAGAPMEAHVIRCRRHNGRPVWHLTAQDQEGRTA